MSVSELTITNPKKQLEFYKDLSEQLQQKNEGLENINDKLSSALNSAEQRIDKAMGFINMIYEIGSYSKSMGLDDEEVNELYSILKGEDKE